MSARKPPTRQHDNTTMDIYATIGVYDNAMRSADPLVPGYGSRIAHVSFVGGPQVYGWITRFRLIPVYAHRVFTTGYPEPLHTRTLAWLCFGIQW